MLLLIWAIFNFIMAIMTVFGNEDAGMILAWSIIALVVVAIIVGISNAYK